MTICHLRGSNDSVDLNASASFSHLHSAPHPLPLLFLLFSWGYGWWLMQHTSLNVNCLICTVFHWYNPHFMDRVLKTDCLYLQSTPLVWSGNVTLWACCGISHVVFVFGLSLLDWLGIVLNMKGGCVCLCVCVCIDLWQCLFFIEWPCAVDRMLKSTR